MHYSLFWCTMLVLFAFARPFFVSVFTKAVSESLNSLIHAAAQDRTADPSTASAHSPPSSELAESKAVADDVMVQITARKSEVGPQGGASVSCSLQSETFPSSPRLLAVKQMNNQK